MSVLQNSETDNTQPNPSLDLTEEEATRYDRQMRLWGIEAQQRMRNATILVLNLRGVTTEAIKNMVLAGIGKLIIVDGENVSEEDLGAGFFFRDGDVGLNRLDVAKSRIESLNPLVTVEIVTDKAFAEGERLESLVKDVDLVCVADWDRDNLIKLNELCRKHSKPFYAGGTYGLNGYIFCDLLSHDYLAPDRSAPKEQPRSVKATTVYTPLSSAIGYRWSGLSKRQTKEVNPALFFAILAIWQFQAVHGHLPTEINQTEELEALANKFISEADVNKQILPTEPRSVIESLSITASHEFSPVCAIVGGVLAQDILKALGGRDPPIANFFLFDGSTGGGTVCRLNIP
ncbi:SUMO-activating enzyme subunit 1 [Psilocybe cubensis]|uniref:SUMO-activating enzyme subunit 1 n=1 Tax=Psilocybe cubensis TaxID=181762 RepID=A0ACB8GZY6_PSICU|nr:SUMO-activating enzyme subunit 1 [Psilocybe cubensis]KAH9480515.1 SUMO-activating enzyme subunit 1 [Psilocybe cubensis]